MEFEPGRTNVSLDEAKAEALRQVTELLSPPKPTPRERAREKVTALEGDIVFSTILVALYGATLATKALFVTLDFIDAIKEKLLEKYFPPA